MSEIDPQEFGAMRARMDAMEKEQAQLVAQMHAMSSDIKELLALANQGKGSLWMFLTLAGVVGAVLSKLFTVAGWLPR